MKTIIGVDEVGRGPLAGPLTVCALRLTSESSFFGMRDFKDSKKLTESSRLEIFKLIKREAKQGKLKYAISSTTPKQIDQFGIAEALKKSVDRALLKLGTKEGDRILLDGSLKASPKYKSQSTIVKGDEKELSIALASIVAKVTRDRKMVQISKMFPGYGFEAHKGYGTKMHIRAIETLGETEVHRRTFCKNIKSGA